MVGGNCLNGDKQQRIGSMRIGRENNCCLLQSSAASVSFCEQAALVGKGSQRPCTKERDHETYWISGPGPGGMVASFGAAVGSRRAAPSWWLRRRLWLFGRLWRWMRWLYDVVLRLRRLCHGELLRHYDKLLRQCRL
jgi:hypothetical protein